MTSRRKFISGAAALAAYAAFEKAAVAASPNVIAGAIRWDAWYSTTSLNPVGAQNALGPQVYQYRAPWFSKVLNNFQIQANGSQANMDVEIQCAANAGLKYWAFDQFASSSGFTNAWNLYQSSSFNNLINWCWISGGDLLGGTGNYATQVAQLVAWFQQSNYQKVATNRPVLYFNFSSVPANFGGVLANFQAMLSALQSACATVGLGNPYIVVNGAVPSNHNFAVQISADAISAYAAVVVTATGQPGTYSQMATGAKGFWAQCASTGSNVVPNCVTGWDVRPRAQNPVPFQEPGAGPPYAGLLNYFTPGTPSQIASHIQDAVNYVAANPSTCPSTLILIYSWTECDEGGGCLIPTIGDPPAGNTTNVLSAIGAVLN